MSERLSKLELYEEDGAGDDDGAADDGAGDDSIVPGLVGFALTATVLVAIGYGVKQHYDEKKAARFDAEWDEIQRGSAAREAKRQQGAQRHEQTNDTSLSEYLREWRDFLGTPEGVKFARKEPRIASYYLGGSDAYKAYLRAHPEPPGAVRPKPPFIDPTPTQLVPMRRSSAPPVRSYVIPQQVPPYREALVNAGVGKRTIEVGKTPAERVAYDDWNRRQEQRNSPGELSRWFDAQRAKKER